MWTLGLAVLVAASAACGGGGASKQDFTVEANAICTAANARVSALGREPPLLTPEQAVWVEEVTEISREALQSLRTLDVPEEDRRLIDRMLSAFERAFARGEEIARASRAEDAATFAAAVGEATDQLSGAQLAAAGYGLDACVRLGRGLG